MWISILSDNLAKTLREFGLRNAVLSAGYDDLQAWHGPIADDFGVLPPAPFERSRIYTGDAQTFAYSHVPQICKFAGRYVAVWSNAQRDEDSAGQQIHYSLSEDARHWEPYRCLVATDRESGQSRHAAGLCVSAGKLVAYSKTEYRLKANLRPGIPSFEGTRIDAFVTSDCVDWKEYKDLISDAWMLEGPKATRSGRLLCPGFHNEGMPVAFIWEPDKAWGKPEIIPVPRPGEGARLMEGSWYQTEDGTITMLWRDETQSLRLYIAFSDDDGRSWTVPVKTDFPDAMARINAGRLSDGRYYIVGNSCPQLLNRKYLMLSLSNDGKVFDEMFILADGPTHRRIEGRHKEDGYQYPNTLVEEGRLLVVFSVNKEDIECGIVDTTRL